MIKHYEIGDKVFYFKPSIKEEMTIKESIVLGIFVNKQEGELNYFLNTEECPAYAVSDTEDGARQLLDKFLVYKDKLLEANTANAERYTELRKDYLFEDFTIDKLGGGDDE